jgi:hypothetical protein
MRLFVSNILIFFGIVALLFLFYTLLNLDKLGISVNHPRVMVELILFIVFTILGIILRVSSFGI